MIFMYFFPVHLPLVTKPKSLMKSPQNNNPPWISRLCCQISLGRNYFHKKYLNKYRPRTMQEWIHITKPTLAYHSFTLQRLNSFHCCWSPKAIWAQLFPTYALLLIVRKKMQNFFWSPTCSSKTDRCGKICGTRVNKGTPLYCGANELPRCHEQTQS